MELNLDKEMTLRSILEGAPDAMIIINEQGEIMMSNKQTEKLFGYSKNDLLGQKIEILIPDRYRAKHVHHRSDYFLQPRTRLMGSGLELFGIRRNGEEFPVEISLAPMQTEEGLFTLAAVRDISDREACEKMLREKNLELENANQAKDRFLATMSHELRTPLNAIIGFTGTLLMKLPGPLNPEQEKQLKTIQNSAKHLLSLINDILDLTKIESGKIELQLTDVNCVDVIHDVFSSLSALAQSKGIVLNIDIPNIDLHAKTDRRALTQVLINLTNNAIKFTEKGSVSISADLIMKDKNKSIAISVIDTGIGIQEQDKGKLFKAFEQLRLSDKLFEGTGLGLYLSQRLIELINGKIEFESEHGKGSRFVIFIPQNKDNSYDN